MTVFEKIFFLQTSKMRPSLFEKTPRSADLQGSLVFIFIFLSFFLSVVRKAGIGIVILFILFIIYIFLILCIRLCLLFYYIESLRTRYLQTLRMLWEAKVSRSDVIGRNIVLAERAIRLVVLFCEQAALPHNSTRTWMVIEKKQRKFTFFIQEIFVNIIQPSKAPATFDFF